MEQQAECPAAVAGPDSYSAVDRRRALRDTLAGASCALAAVVAGVLGLWTTSERTVRDNYHHYLTGLALAAAQQVDPALHALIREPEQLNDEDYQRVVAPLRRMRMVIPDIRYIYTTIRDDEEIRFVLDAADPGDNDGDGVEDQSGVWEAYEDADPAMLAALGTDGLPGVVGATKEPYSDKWGTFMSGYAPIVAPDGRQIAVIGVDVDASVYARRIARARNVGLIGLIPAGLLILGLSAAFYRIRVLGLQADRDVQLAALHKERAAEGFRVERQRLRNVIDGIGAGTWEWNLVTGDVLVNERWANMLGYDVEQLGRVSNRTWQELIHPADVSAVAITLEGCLAGTTSVYEVDYRMRHREGHWVWISARGNVIERSPALAPLRMAGTHQDISERKAAEIALTSSEAKFRGLFELSPIGIALNDYATGQFLEVNDALVSPTGYSRKELLSLTYWAITPESYAAGEQAQLDAMESGGRYGPFEKEYIRKDGSVYPVLLSGMRMTDPSGRQVIWSIVQDISQRKAMESKLTEAARCDKLTGLANRTLFMERLQHAIDRVRSGEQSRLAVLFLDFDHFKLINDTLGHEAGDELLRQIAGRLRSALRASDAMTDEAGGNVVARFGGDEFVVLINDFNVISDATRVAERLLNALAPVFSVGGRDVHSTASIGIVSSEQGLQSAEAVIRNADVAMYEAKRSGRGCSVVFNEAMHTRLTRHVTIESALRKAFGTNQLSLVYQPIVELETGRTVSVEALLRWEHPDLGAVSPAEFIPIAEDSGLIVTLGAWVLEEACTRLQGWRQTDPQQAPEYISVNLSRAELSLGDRLLVRIKETLSRSGLPPNCLQIEVTEREVMRDPAASQMLMRNLRAIGVRLAMDDFGTGTSSLACLRDYPFDTVKIDRSFISDLAANRDVLAVIHATTTLIENLGMASIAEGVESASQVAILQSAGCRYAQGYFFSRPLTAEQWLQRMGTRPLADKVVSS